MDKAQADRILTQALFLVGKDKLDRATVEQASQLRDLFIEVTSPGPEGPGFRS